MHRARTSQKAATTPDDARLAGYDWRAFAAELDSGGCAILSGLLSPTECKAIAAIYPDENRFRTNVQMARHGYGKGEYRYFKYPLPERLQSLRTALYP